ncbi:MAG TPA: hypothetical protein VGB76_07840, partial [Pyrinomonadaceae bacterium]
MVSLGRCDALREVQLAMLSGTQKVSGGQQRGLSGEQISGGRRESEPPLLLGGLHPVGSMAGHVSS